MHFKDVYNFVTRIKKVANKEMIIKETKVSETKTKKPAVSRVYEML